MSAIEKARHESVWLNIEATKTEVIDKFGDMPNGSQHIALFCHIYFFADEDGVIDIDEVKNIKFYRDCTPEKVEGSLKAFEEAGLLEMLGNGKAKLLKLGELYDFDVGDEAEE